MKNTWFIIFFRKKVYFGNIQCFLFIVWWKQWNKQKIIEKSTFSVKRNFFRVMAYIPFCLTKKRWSFLDEMLIILKSWKGIIYAILRKKKNCNKKLIYFFLFPSFSIKTWKCKEKTLKILFLKEIYIFFIEIACIT